MRNACIAIVMGGLILGAAATASAQEMAMATPGPNMEAPSKEFVVFANRDGRSLSPTALDTLRMAASEAAASSKVTLVGRPAETAAVKAELVRQGVPGQAIAVRHEARAPIAKPSDGLGDPLDRRVEIKL